MDSASALPLTLVAGTAAIAFLWWSRHWHTLASGARAEVLPGRPAQDPQRGPPQGQISQKRSARQPLEILYPEPTDNKDDTCEVDIIAVHGLGSDVDWSWTWKDGDRHVHWLSDHDMLPAKVPTARIIAYNYDSRWHSNAPKTRLQLCGEELIHSIHSFRDNAHHRPIIFVGHSLGGNVIVQAMLYASNEDKYKHFAMVTAGVVFLGSPLRGTKWQPFLDSLTALMGPAGSHRGITRELGFDEPELLDRLHRFCRLRNSLLTPVACFSELYETDYGRRSGVGGLVKGIVVEEASACIPGLDRYALQADHLKMNKYQGPSDRSFLSVSRIISEMCHGAKKIVRLRHDPKEVITGSYHVLEHRPEAKNCLRDLFLTDPHEDKAALKRKKGDRARGTCEWILGTEVLTDWLGTIKRPDLQILWLHGNPGTGKSTMAIFLAEALSESFSTTDGKMLAYFFCDSAFDTRKTAISIIRGLLLQLVQQQPRLLAYILPKYDERGADLFTSFDALWTTFMEVAADESTGRKYLIIDAIDECEEESRETLLCQLRKAFQGRGAPSTMSFLITSRPYPEIRRYFKESPNRDLASFLESRRDIDHCINERVAQLAHANDYTRKIAEKVRNILRDKAEGTFLWVGIACNELACVPSKDAIPLLEKMPKGLHSLYKRLLDTALEQNTAKADEVRLILSLVTVSRRPLSLMELAEVCQLHADEDDAETRAQFMREHIESCRLLVIIQEGRIFLLHKSVKDFLTGTGAGHVHKLEAHADLAYRCIGLLIKKFRDGQPLHYFAKYAIKEWPNHARLARSRFRIKTSQMSFFEMNSPWWDEWLKSYRTLQEGWPIARRFTALHLAAYWGLPALARHLACSYGPRGIKGDVRLVDYTDDGGFTPLESACATPMGHLTVVSILLDMGARVTTRALEDAAWRPHSSKKVMALLLDRGGDKISISAEVMTAAASNVEVMRLLLDRRRDISITDKVLRAAAGNKWCGAEVMELLLDRRGDEIIITGEVMTAAAGNWRCGKEVMKLLLTRQREISVTKEVVTAAAENQQSGKEVIAMLLDRPSYEGFIMDVVVKAAAGYWQGGKEVLATLFNRRRQVISITDEVLKAAAGNWDSGEEVLALMLDQCKDEVSITDEVVRAAVGNEKCGKDVMELLIDRRGKEFTITDEVMKVAAGNWGSGEEVLALMLDRRGEEANITDEVVRAAAGNWKCGKEITKLLLDRRRDISITDKVMRAAAGNEWCGAEVMELLLDRRGEEISVTDEVVRLAARHWKGGKEVLALLLDRGGEDICITDEMVAAAARNRRYGEEILALLLDRGGEDISITDEVVRAAAGNSGCGKAVMALLIDRRGKEFSITDEVVRAAAGNSGCGKAVMALLIDRRGKEFSITDEVMKVAAGNWPSGMEVMTLLLDRQRDVAAMTGKAASIIAENFHTNLMALLLDRGGEDICITDEMVAAAARNRRYGEEILALLLDRGGEDISITDEVVRAAAGNSGCGKAVMALLINRRGKEFSITDEMIKAAAGNRGNGKEILALLLDCCGEEISITDKVLKAAAGNWRYGKEVLAQLLSRCREESSITDEVVRAAAGNRGCGKEVMELLLDQRRKMFSITDEVVRAAAGNKGCGKEVMELLLDRRRKEFSITDEVLRAAASNSCCGKEVLQLLLDPRREDTSITSEAAKGAARGGDCDKEVTPLDRQEEEIGIADDMLKATAGSRHASRAWLYRLSTREKRGSPLRTSW
ncbi:hypothetical protein Purlil1_13560 [Purpureocillium lilacinum]|uniref:NACHT domain-containing protein n=1 Tax=Purpureocillium lilacinum TaxID=33203 RepID=A0ABR0BDV3_PURLI|nr:hypothetical protein Purlil1_13560 [Purpureocillium lilacinum]